VTQLITVLRLKNCNQLCQLLVTPNNPKYYYIFDRTVFINQYAIINIVHAFVSALLLSCILYSYCHIR